MKTIYKYWKNSNTGELLKSQEFTETRITDLPINYYNTNGDKVGENLDLKGFVEIKEKKFSRHKGSITTLEIKEENQSKIY